METETLQKGPCYSFLTCNGLIDWYLDGSPNVTFYPRDTIIEHLRGCEPCRSQYTDILNAREEHYMKTEDLPDFLKLEAQSRFHKAKKLHIF